MSRVRPHLRRLLRFLAAGIAFKSFELVDSTALLAVEFGPDLTFSLLGKSTRILMEAAPESVDPDGLRRALLATVPGVRDVHDVHCWSLTTGQTMLTLHVALARDADAARVLRDAKRVIAEEFDITHSALQIEHEECPDEA